MHDYEYRLVKAAPAVPAGEIDGDADVVTIAVKWGRNTLHIAQVDGDRSYWIGETEDAARRCDYFVPGDKLGCARAPLVIAGAAVVLPGAVGTITVGDAPAMPLAEAIAAGKCSPSAALDGAHQLPLTAGTTVRMQLDDLIFELRGEKQARRTAMAWSFRALAGGAVAYVLGSLVGHAGLLAAMASFMPPLGVTDEDGLTDDQRHYLLQMTEARAHVERDAHEDEAATADHPGDEGGTGERHKGDEGSMGDPTSRAVNRRAALEGPPDNTDPHMSRMRAIEDAQSFGAIGLLTSLSANPDAPISPLGWDQALGNDPLSANGNMWANTIGDAHGAGGLGLTGIGEGGGGFGRGYGLDSVGGLGHGAGGGDDLGFGPGGSGLSGGRLPPRHQTRVPRMRDGVTEVGGRIPPEVIQRIVRQNYGRFRACYESALRTDPNLQGRVAVSFAIGRDGTVRAAHGGGDLPHGGVISCVAGAFMGLTFPQPDGGGVVRVTYPIVFSPAG